MTATFHPSQDFQRIRRQMADGPGRAVTMPNYTIRRAAAIVVMLAVLAASAVGVGEVVGAVADLGGRPAAASEVASALGDSTPGVHVAGPGDTLWSIAQQYRGGIGHDRYVDALIDLNGDTTIQVGQAVRLP